MIKEDRQTNRKTFNFDRIDVVNDYDITRRLTTIDDIKQLINKVIDDCYSKNIKDKYDVDFIEKINISFSQPTNCKGGKYDSPEYNNRPPSIKVEIGFYTWETKAEMYSRRSYDKRQLEDKKAKLEREASYLGYKLEKLNE